MKNNATYVNIAGEGPTIMPVVAVSAAGGSMSDEIGYAGRTIVEEVNGMQSDFPDKSGDDFIDKLVAQVYDIRRTISAGVKPVVDAYKEVSGIAPAISPAPIIDGTVIENTLNVGSVPASEVERMRKAAGKGLRFSPIGIRLYSREKSKWSFSKLLNAAGQETDPALIELMKGTYILRFEIPEVDQAPFFEVSDKIPINFGTGAGIKKIDIEKARLDPGSKELTVQIHIKDNPIPLLALIGLAGAGLGLAGWGLSSSLKSVDRVVLDTGNMAIKAGVVFGGGYLAYLYLKKRKKRRA